MICDQWNEVGMHEAPDQATKNTVFSDSRSYTYPLKGNTEKLINENINEKPPQSFCPNYC